MRNFEIKGRPAQLYKVNPYTENHNDTEVVRMSIHFMMVVDPDDLSRFATSDTSVYWADKYRELLYVTERRMFSGHQIGDIGFNRVFEHHGLAVQIPDKRKPCQFADVKLCKFRALLQEDGETMMLKFQVHLDPGEDVDALVNAMGQTVTISTTPPAQIDIEDVANHADPAEEEESEEEET